MGVSKVVPSQWKILKRMIWGYPHFRKPPYVPFIDHWLLQCLSCLRGSSILSYPIRLPYLLSTLERLMLTLLGSRFSSVPWHHGQKLRFRQMEHIRLAGWSLVQNPWLFWTFINSQWWWWWWRWLLFLFYDDSICLQSTASNIQNHKPTGGHPPTQSASNVPRVYCGERLSFSRWNCTILVG